MNSRTLIESFGYIDPKFVERSERRTASGRVLTRFAAVAAALLLVLGAVFGVVKAAGEKTNSLIPKDAVLPPSQVGKTDDGSNHTSDTLYNRSYTLGEMYEEAESVALVKIGNWLGENDVGSYFEAEVEKIYKGDLPGTILIYQTGNSESILSGSPLYTYGDRILVGLKTWDREEKYQKSYQRVGADIAFLYAVEADEGIYLIDHKGILSYRTALAEGENRFTNYADDDILVRKLLKTIAAIDKPISDELSEYYEEYLHSKMIEREMDRPMRIYSIEEIENYFMGL